MAPNLSGLMSGQKLSASNCPSTNCFRVNVSFANFLHSQYPPFANSSIGCKTKPFIYSETKSRLLERKEVTQGHEMRWLKSSVSSQKALQHMNLSLRNCCLNAAQHIGRSLICNTTPQCYTPPINMVLLDDGDGYKDSWALDKHIWRGGWVLRWTSISHYLETLWTPAVILQVCSVQPYIALRSLKPTL